MNSFSFLTDFSTFIVWNYLTTPNSLYLPLLLIIILVGVAAIIFFNKSFSYFIALVATTLNYFIVLLLWYFSQKSEFMPNKYWSMSFSEDLSHSFFFFFDLKLCDNFNFLLLEPYNFCLGLDSISFPFVLITCFIMPLCILWEYPYTNKRVFTHYPFVDGDGSDIKVKSLMEILGFTSSKNSQFNSISIVDNITLERQKKHYLKLWLICLLFIEFFLLLAFSSLNLFFFYVAFEAVLIPMFIMIGIWGTRVRKIMANYYFFFFTFFFSMFFLIALLFIDSSIGSLDFLTLQNASNRFSREDQIVLFILFYLALAAKVPVFPFHIWLPEAHVEAPTIGSVILASLLLKLGGYGFIRFPMVLFPEGMVYCLPIIQTLSILGVVYASLSAIVQPDMKKLIAYSSVAHMNFAMLGLFSLNIYGLQGAYFLMVSHSFVSAGLFFLIGVLYDRYHTRLIEYFSGLAITMPVYSVYLACFLLANFGFPLTSSFPAELLIILGLFASNKVVFFFAILGLFLSIIYCMWLFNRIVFGTYKVKVLPLSKDLEYSERFCLTILWIYVFLLGIFPTLLFDFVHISLIQILFFNF